MTLLCAAAAPGSGDAFINPGSTDSRETQPLMDHTVTVTMHASRLAYSVSLGTPHPERMHAAVQPWHCELVLWSAGGECGVVYIGTFIS